MALYEIISGNIVEDIRYQVVGDTSITYNSIVYNAGTFFTGVNGVTTYTKTGGTEVVTEASIVDGSTFGFENDVYLGLFNDESKVLGTSIGINNPAYLYEIVSGNIIEGVEYQVYDGTSITYNSITYNDREFFTGVNAVTTYTKTTGDEIVIEVSSFIGATPRIEADFYLDLLNDDSTFKGATLLTDEFKHYLYNVKYGEILEGVEYQVFNGDSVSYNDILYSHGDFFIGVADKTSLDILTYFTPIMTSNTTPSGESSSSTQYLTYDPWKAFNRTSIGEADCWFSDLLDSIPHQIAYESISEKIINRVVIVNRDHEPSSMSRSPSDFKIQGSNDGIIWDNLSIITGEVWTTHKQSKTFSFNNEISYLYYAIEVDAIQDPIDKPDNGVAISQINFYYDDSLVVITESSSFIGQASSIENGTYLGLFNDDSTFLGLSIELEIQIFQSHVVRTTYKRGLVIERENILNNGGSDNVLLANEIVDNGGEDSDLRLNEILEISAFRNYELVLDIDAQAFIDATGITDETQQSAINTLVIGLKTASIWTKFNAIYPFIGGTAGTHKYNLIDPRDLDAAFRLSFSELFTHSSNGVQAISTTGHIDTHLLPRSVLPLNSTHFSIYSRTNSVSDYQDIGSSDAAGTNAISAYLSLSGSYYSRIYDTGYVLGSVANSLGLFTTSRTASNSTDSYKNGIFVANSSNAPVDIAYLSMYLGNIHVQSTVVGPQRQYAFATIGGGLTNTNALDLYTLVQAYQTTLERQV